MNRTTAFLAVAAALLLTAVVLGLPRSSGAPAPTPNAPPVTVAPPTPPAPPAPPPVATPGSLSLTGRLSHPYLVPGTSELFATLEVTAVDVPGAARAPVNLGLVIDRSGSMAGDKIASARAAASGLVDLLNEHDRLSVVHYGTDVSAMGGVFCTPENKEKLKRFIARITEEGGTNIGDGLAVGERHVVQAATDFRVNRVILVSDGQPTVGVTSAQGLASVVRKLRSHGLSVTSLGVGADYNEDLMQRLADEGGGAYGFISGRDPSAMATLFRKDLEQAGALVARGATVQFTLPAGVDFVEVFGRSVSRSGQTVTVALPDFSARQVEKLVVRLRATPGVQAGAVDIGAFELRYTDLLKEAPAEARLALSAMVTTDGALAQKNRDKEAVITASRAQAAVNYQRAAEAIDQGDFARAQRSLEANQQIFFDADEVAGKGAMDDERKANDTVFGLSTAAPTTTPELRRESVKKMKSQSLKSTGRAAVY